ncbi:MAG TPA: hypothetical protein PKA00_11425 [Saprospiraceae bacterium]|mgnify:CR=1 FL=1|nr:hypothetical protein [Saprospiraceae bacterium]HMQ83513.1 hypothetical protein [Saprospiraceae bacterium]
MRTWNFSFWLPVLLLIGLAFTGCKKDDDGAGSLEECLTSGSGEWVVTSFTEDGDELVGSSALFNAFQLRFNQYNRADQRGSFSWTLIYLDGSTEIWSGNYEIIESTSEVEMTFLTGVSGFVIFKTECIGERLELDGNLDGFKWVIQARK